ncbi:ATP-binding protein [Streptomyces sp. NPDC091278]|uniref:ATP-binding protein n=1 Tax=Streptomyces sp. NPDC091278 TaxID=3155301 RepID=UPI00344FE9F5
MTPPLTHEETVTVRVFAQRFSSTPRGARLARRLALLQLHCWHFPYGCELSDTVGLLVAELAANAVTHGRVPGRDCELELSYLPGRRLRIEVSDTRGERRPALGERSAPRPLDEGGRGLLLVAALATRWEVLDRLPVGKTVRAEIDLGPYEPRPEGVSPADGAPGRTPPGGS